jgi:hypothetical protein
MYLCGFSCKPFNQNSHGSVKQLDFRAYVRSFDKDEKIRQKYSLYFIEKQYIIIIALHICLFMMASLHFQASFHFSQDNFFSYVFYSINCDNS